ncbi:MAG: alpha-mannosidase [Clostridiales Family XIII bacterium]|nr:alpha-mannosidase [Clostridiales Family XIII bacterium]
MNNKTKKCYIIPHTHWDREWRWPIWKTRKLLADFMHELLDILDSDKDYHYFLMDGQVAPIVDYLEIFPGDRERLERHIRSGRIGIGPWYTLPDLYPISGECLLRNLNKGLSVCDGFGAHLSIGYNSFGWGQTAQLPQIYADYGFEIIVCAKKVSDARAPYAEFLWESPDGTQVLTSRLGSYARANFFFHAYIDVRYGLKFLSDEFAYAPAKAGLATHRADSALRDEDWFLSEPKKGHDWSRLKEGLCDSFDAAANTLMPETVLLLSGCDFSTPQPDLAEIVRRASECFPGTEFINASIEDYARELKGKFFSGGAPNPAGGTAHECADGRSLPTVFGELRDGPACDCSGNALSVRCYLKQLNKKAQTAIIGCAEPFSAFAEAAGQMEYPGGFLDKAWEYMLDSQSHDAINGVTRDKTADDIENRLLQAIELGDTAMNMAAEAIIKALDLAAFSEEASCSGEDASYVIVFNPSPRPVRDILRFSVDTLESERAWDVALCALGGGSRTEAIQAEGRTKISAPVHDLDGRPWPFYGDRHCFWADTGEIPAMGYRVFRVRRVESYQPRHHYWLPMRKSFLPDIASDAGTLENEFLSVRVQPNGTFDLVEKESGASYSGLNRFEDTGDAGNYWVYYPHDENRTYTSLGSAPRIWVGANGPLVGTIAVEYEMKIPAYGFTPQYGFGRSERAKEHTVMRIETRITLKRGSRRVEIETDVENSARDHRLRVAMPTGIVADSAAASGHFTTDARPVAPARDADGGYWPEMQTLPMQTFVDVSDGNRALAFLSGDILEYEASPDAERTVKLTLFRAVENMIVTGWECVNRFPNEGGSQLQRKMSFAYAVFPHSGNAGSGLVYAEADAFLKMPMPWQFYGSPAGKGGQLPPETGFMEIAHKELVLSAFKKADDGDGYVLRVYNPTGSEVNSSVEFAWPIRKACSASMREAGRGAASWEGGRLHVRAPGGKILTYRIWF